MTPARDRSRKGRSPITTASEPTSYDRRFYARAISVGFLVIIISIVFAVYNFAFKAGEPGHEPSFDLGSLFMTDSRIVPSPRNPCIVIQEYLETIREGRYRKAYGYLCAGLKREVTYEAFVSNAEGNDLLFRDISGYRFSGYRVDGTAAGADGYIEYRAGGRSRVEAAFAQEGLYWRIAQMTLIFQ